MAQQLQRTKTVSLGPTDLAIVVTSRFWPKTLSTCRKTGGLSGPISAHQRFSVSNFCFYFREVKTLLNHSRSLDHPQDPNTLPVRMRKNTPDPCPVPLLCTRLFSILPAASPPRVRIRLLGRCYATPMAPSIPPFRSAASFHSVAMARAPSHAARGTSGRAAPIFGSGSA
jgi:hypothetical protein